MSIYKSAHYATEQVKDDEAMGFLRERFPDAEADNLNFVLFSTSGIHGSCTTMEEAWLDRERLAAEDAPEPYTPSVTFVLVMPRRVSMIYGNATIASDDDFAFLQKLRASSRAAMLKIGGDPR